MEDFDRKKHWENIYQTKELKNVGWYQPVPSTSLSFIKKMKVPLTARVIDIGGGDSFLVDHLLDMGYQDISVLDISEAAINRAQNRLRDKAKMVKWIVADITSFKPIEKYDLWHDRAAFHFLTSEADIQKYLTTVQENINPCGVMIMGTFSKQGPKKCSSLEITQYSERSLTNRLNKFFKKIECITIDHTTPFDTVQNYVFCSFRKRQKKLTD
jgi:trans-aconitate methyltransferase